MNELILLYIAFMIHLTIGVKMFYHFNKDERYLSRLDFATGFVLVLIWPIAVIVAFLILMITGMPKR